MTLVETIMAVAIFTILILAIFSTTTVLYQQNAYTIGQVNEVNNARRGVVEWRQDVREITTAEDGTFAVAVIEPHRFGYYADTMGDSVVEYIEYELIGTTLEKRVYIPTGTPLTYDTTNPDETNILSEYVQNLGQGTSTFMYYDNAGNRLSVADPLLSMTYVTMQLIVNIDPVRNPGEFMLRSSVAPRNLKNNL
jgi:hypothetical protein